MEKYQAVTTRLEQDLTDVSFDELDISDEVKEQVRSTLSYKKQGCGVTSY